MRIDTHRQQDHTASTKYLLWDAKTFTNWHFSSIKYTSANKCFLESLWPSYKKDRVVTLHRVEQTDTSPLTETHKVCFFSCTKPKQSNLNSLISSELINATNRCFTFPITEPTAAVSYNSCQESISKETLKSVMSWKWWRFVLYLYGCKHYL